MFQSHNDTNSYQRYGIPHVPFSPRCEALSKLRTSIRMQSLPRPLAKRTVERCLSVPKIDTKDLDYNTHLPEIASNNKKLHNVIHIGKYSGRNELFGKTPKCNPDYTPNLNMISKDIKTRNKNLHVLAMNQKSQFFDINDLIDFPRSDRDRKVMDEQDQKLLVQLFGKKPR